MHPPRPYQIDALKAILAYWLAGGENPLVELATGTGKSLLQAMLCKYLLDQYPDMRIISVTHVKELIQQNHNELKSEWASAPAGINSAGLKSRETQSQILFCGIQSVHGKAKRIGLVDLVMVDEAHLIPRSADTMYGRFLGELAQMNPHMKVVGFTATPYRTDSGRLDEGEVRMFDQTVYTYGVADGIKDGFLSPLVSKGTATGFDLTGVARRGGDFIPGALQAAVDKDSVTRAAVAEMVATGHSRRSWLAFCAGVEHAAHVRDAIRAHGITCETVTGETPSKDRARFLEDFKSGKIRCLTNNSVLTTGFNHPGVDLLAMLRPTLSCGLYVQMAGRGTRIAPGKKNCLVLDFAGNVRRHGPVDAVVPKAPGKGDGCAPIKECEVCHSLVHLSARECPDCGAPFPIKDEPKHQPTAEALPILSAPHWVDVLSRQFFLHAKPGGTPTIRAEFWTPVSVVYKTWLCPGHTGFAKSKADKFWRQHGGEDPPRSPEEWLSRQSELEDTRSIKIRLEGQYWKVIDVEVGELAAA